MMSLPPSPQMTSEPAVPVNRLFPFVPVTVHSGREPDVVNHL